LYITGCRVLLLTLERMNFRFYISLLVMLCAISACNLLSKKESHPLVQSNQGVIQLTNFVPYLTEDTVYESVLVDYQIQNNYGLLQILTFNSGNSNVYYADSLPEQNSRTFPIVYRVPNIQQPEMNVFYYKLSDNKWTTKTQDQTTHNYRFNKRPACRRTSQSVPSHWTEENVLNQHDRISGVLFNTFLVDRDRFLSQVLISDFLHVTMVTPQQETIHFFIEKNNQLAIATHFFESTVPGSFQIKAWANDSLHFQIDSSNFAICIPKQVNPRQISNDFFANKKLTGIIHRL